ncbi:MAG: hypothetical protein OEZ06_10535 [Myxococcales bacterium]|nr:hypothetical protein [Myxococcales bacterium]
MAQLAKAAHNLRVERTSAAPSVDVMNRFGSRPTQTAPALFCLVLTLLAACGDDSSPVPEPEAGIAFAPFDASLPLPPKLTPHDSAIPDFSPPDAVAPIEAYNENEPPDAAVDATVIAPPPRTDCLQLEPGESLRFEDMLDAEHTWLRIAPDDGCPAMLVTAREVAYRAYKICDSQVSRSLTITMEGDDRLPMPPRATVADPMLVVYADEQNAFDSPFDCLAVNDDGLFDGFAANSARIADLSLEPGKTVVVLATSYESPDQRGIGLFALSLSAE